MWVSKKKTHQFFFLIYTGCIPGDLMGTKMSLGNFQVIPQLFSKKKIFEVFFGRIVISGCPFCRTSTWKGGFQKITFSGAKKRRKFFFFKLFFQENCKCLIFTKKVKKVEKKVFLLQLQRFFDPKNEHPQMTILLKNTSKIAKS